MSDTEPTRVVRDLVTEQGNAPTLLSWQGEQYDHKASPVGGESVGMGVNAMMTATGHDWSDTPTHIEVRNTAWGDYCGGTAERSNARSLARDFPETFVTVTGGFGSEYLALPIDAEIPEYLYDLLVSLADDYPLYDESDHSELESEIERECWESYGRYDLTREILAELGDEAEAMMPEDAELDAMFYAAQEDTSFYAECEDATSCYWPELKSTAVAIADAIVKSYRETTPRQGETLPTL